MSKTFRPLSGVSVLSRPHGGLWGQIDLTGGIGVGGILKYFGGGRWNLPLTGLDKTLSGGRWNGCMVLLKVY